MEPLKKQYQHVVPQVYLKQFGFQKKAYGDKWCVSTFDSETKEWKDRVIKKFLGVNNLYDFSPSVSSFPRRIEKELHWGVEKRLLSIPKYLEGRFDFTLDMKKEITETMANFFCRSIRILKWIENVAKQGKFEKFFMIITQDNGVFNSEEDRLEVLKKIESMDMKDMVNNLLIFYMLHVKLILINADMSIYFNNGGFDLFTCDNPVICTAPGPGLLVDPSMQMFFPLNKDLLIHSYWNPDSLPLKSIKPKPFVMQPINEELYYYFNHDLVKNRHDKFIISPIEKAILDEEE